MRIKLSTLLYLFTLCGLTAQENLIINTESRKSVSLNGTWHYIVDPYETGGYDYRLKERNENDPGAYWNVPAFTKKSDWTEHGYSDKYSIQVPGDWNSQVEALKYYEGVVWYHKSFDKPEISATEDAYIYFGAVNYKTTVYLNGKKLGMHKGGFTPFNFKVPSELLKEANNNLVVMIDNKRFIDEIPTTNTDWWNYGGITRDVKLLILPKQFVKQYHIQLDEKTDIAVSTKSNMWQIKGWVKLNEAAANDKILIEIPELKINKEFKVSGDSVAIAFNAKNLSLWSTKNPKLYNVNLKYKNVDLIDKIGFRTIKVEGERLLLNGKDLFLRGICLHEEVIPEVRRAHSMKDALKLFGYVKELHGNMVRLSHYPHNENMVRAADSLGVLVWDEIPVYWTIDFGNSEVLKKAQRQLKEMVARDRNRASVFIWSVGNETPVSEKRNLFMSTLVKNAKELDPTRLVSAALEVRYNAGVNYVDDPLGEYTDIVSLNEYLGWYGSTPDGCKTAEWGSKYKKPFFISETGAEAKTGFNDSKESRFSEEYQEWFYKEQIDMFKNRFPKNYVGVSPWILIDFKSPKRNNPDYQNGFNRKGLIDEHGNKKKAFYILQQYYIEQEQKEGNQY
ncbi:glycoside hydrolase family 2 protein [Flavobacterium aquicola]|uniref:Beta-glucuronidase n=1 Tax=Flavobacterium aquicola TaxID=1682742 RepID=A0A3E0EL12_9FLAO|nr:glycoside hydrolase family 2 TIM barrel-domain containing protein [Flavobacterium aquicola]REG98861.1 beta-glucuronidase [Flavobacterium aquicola]